MITPSPDISAVWPEVFEAVVTSLRRRGVGLHSAEDATQEAGSRVLANGIGFVDADDLRRWVQTVAWRVAIDESRRLARYDGSEKAVDTASLQEVPVEVEHRLRLAATSKAWRTLSPADRRAIVSDADADTATRKEAVRLAVRRHRARARLLALVEGVAAVVLVPFRRLRRMSAAVVVAAAVPVTALLLPFVTQEHGPVGGGSDGPSAPAPARPLAKVALADTISTPVDAVAERVAVAGAERAPSGGAPPKGRSALQGIDKRVDTPMADDHDPYVRTEPKDAGRPVFCTTQPETGRVCTPPLPVTVPPPPPVPGVDL